MNRNYDFPTGDLLQARFLENLMEIDPATGLTTEDLEELRRRFRHLQGAWT